MQLGAGRESSNFEDRRGMGIGVGGGLGVGGIVIALIAYFLGIDPTPILNGMQSSAPTTQSAQAPQRSGPEDEGTRFVRVKPEVLRSWLPVEAGAGMEDHIYMIDPLGNLMMRFPKNADPNKIKKDIAKLLKASSIG